MVIHQIKYCCFFPMETQCWKGKKGFNYRVSVLNPHQQMDDSSLSSGVFKESQKGHNSLIKAGNILVNTWDNRPGRREDPFVCCGTSIFTLIIKQKRGNAAFPHFTMWHHVLWHRTPALKLNQMLLLFRLIMPYIFYRGFAVMPCRIITDNCNRTRTKWILSDRLYQKSWH